MTHRTKALAWLVSLALILAAVDANAGPGPQMPDWDTLVDGQIDRMNFMCWAQRENSGCELIFSRTTFPVTITVVAQETTTSNLQEQHPTRRATVSVLLPNKEVVSESIDFTDGSHVADADRRTTAPCFGQWFPQCPQHSVIWDRDGADVRNILLKHLFGETGVLDTRALYRHGHILNFNEEMTPSERMALDIKASLGISGDPMIGAIRETTVSFPPFGPTWPGTSLLPPRVSIVFEADLWIVVGAKP